MTETAFSPDELCTLALLNCELKSAVKRDLPSATVDLLGELSAMVIKRLEDICSSMQPKPVATEEPANAPSPATNTSSMPASTGDITETPVESPAMIETPTAEI